MGEAGQAKSVSAPLRVRCAGVALSVGPREAFLACYEAMLASRKGGAIFAPDVSLVRRASADARVRAAFDKATFALNDGGPVAAMASLLSGVPTPRYRGADFMRDAFRASRPQTRHFFLGGLQESLDALASQVRALPNFTLAGVYAPPFAAFEAMDLDDIERRLREAGADVVWVFLGNPKQELFCAAMLERMPGVVFAAVGAALEYSTVAGREAPRAVQKAGFEWAWRVYREPRRLWRRYAVTVPQGLVLLANSAVLGLLRGVTGGRSRFIFSGEAA